MRKLVCLSFDAQNALVDLSGFVVSELELRVIRNVRDEGFIAPCFLKYNSIPALLYVFEGFNGFFDSLPSVSKAEWKTCILDLFKCIEIVESNGFLNLCNLSLEPECILFNQTERKLGLFYLPVEGGYFYNSISEFSDSLRLLIRRSCEELGIQDSNLRAVLADSGSDITRMKVAIESYKALSISDTSDGSKKYGIFSGFGFKKSVETKKKEKSTSNPVIHVQGGATEILDETIGVALVYKGSDNSLRIVVKNESCVIGKQKESVDQVIPFSKAVSRIHCKLGFVNGEAHISDLGSSNGTFVNGRRLEKDEVAVIKEGDSVRIANLDFAVEEITL